MGDGVSVSCPINFDACARPDPVERRECQRRPALANHSLHHDLLDRCRGLQPLPRWEATLG